MRIALRVEVLSQAGMEQGLPNLLTLFEQYQIQASFFFNMKPDYPKSFLAAGLSRIRSPFDRSRSAADSGTVFLSEAILASIAAGHEVGICANNAMVWEKKAAFADADWTRHQLALATECFNKITGYYPKLFAAPKCQINPHLLVLEEKMGFLFASDTHGKFPYYPVLQGSRSSCPQIPVTLPTIEAMLLRDGVNPGNVHEYLYAESRHLLPCGHVFTMTADHEGVYFIDIVEKLLVMWKGQEGSVRSLGALYKELDLENLPVHQVGWEEVPEQRQYVAKQSLQVH